MKPFAIFLLLIIAMQAFALAFITIPYTPPSQLEAESYKAYAQAQEIIPVTNIPERVERGQSHETWNLNNAQGEFRTTFGLPTWTFDSSSSTWVPIKIIPQGQTADGALIVQSGLIAVKFLNDQVFFYDANFTQFSNPVSETWVLKNANITIPKIFQSLSLVQQGNDANVTKSYTTPVGNFTVKYVIREGLPLKHEVIMQANVTGSYTTVQQWSVQIDKYIKKDGTIVNLSSLPDGSITVTKDDSLKLLRFEKSALPIIFESLESGWDNFISLDLTKSGSTFTLDFNYGTWTDNIFLDPDTATLTPSQWAKIETTTATGTSCPGAPYSKSTVSGTTTFYFLGESDVSERCHASFFEFDTTSIPDDADVTDTQLKMDMELVNSPNTCDFRPMVQNGAQPSTMSASTAWTEIHDGTPYVSATTTCQTAQDNAQWDLGSQADIDVEGKLTSNWFAVGAHSTDETNRISTTFRASYTCTITPSCNPDDVQVIITYTLPTVTVQITLNASTNSVTPESAGVSFTVSCKDLNGNNQNLPHDGNPALQSFTCRRSDTVSISPPNISTRRWLFSNSLSSASFTSCASGVCATQTYFYYEIHEQTYSISGSPTPAPTFAYTSPPDAAGSSDSPTARNLTLTSTPTTYYAKNTTSWAIASQEITVVANQERYRSYNTTFSGTISAAITGVYPYQHEYNIPTSSSYIFKTLTGNFTLRTAPSAYHITLNNGTALNLISVTYPAWLGQVDPNTNSFTNSTWNTISKTSLSSLTFIVNSTTPLMPMPVSVDTSNRQQWAIDGNTTITNIAYDGTQTQFTWNAQGNSTRTLKVDQVDSAFQKEPSFITINGTRSFDTSSNWSYDSTNKIFTFNNIAFSDNSFVLSYGTGIVSATIYNEFNNTQVFPNEYRIEILGPTNITRVDCTSCSSFDVTVPSDVDSVRIWYRPNRTEAYYRWQVEETPSQTGHQFDFFFANHTDHTLSQYTFTLTDQTGAFGNGTIIRFLKQRDNAAGDITIDEQRIDIEPKSLVYLVRDERYKVQVDNGASVIQVGNFTASTDLDIPMTVNGLLLSNTKQIRHSAIEFDAIHNGTLITTSYLDSTAQTITSSARVFNNTNSSVCTFTSNATTSWQFNCTPVDQFGNYFVQLNVTHSRVTNLDWNFSETIPAHKRGTVLPALNIGLPTNFQNFFGFPVALLGVAFIAMLWAPGKQGFGGIVTSLFAGFFWYAGLFPEAISFTLIAAILLFATLHHITTRRRIAD